MADPGPLLRWVEVLDALETQALSARAGGIADDATGASTPPGQMVWQPPEGLPDMPRELHDRARNIRASQLEVISELRAAVKDNRRHTSLIGAVNAVAAAPGAVYLDVSG